jgi:hypothetical protein
MSAAQPTLGIMIWSSRSPACSSRSTTSRYQNGVSSPLIRTDRHFLPQSTSLIALMVLARALSLSVGATESSRSILITSAALAAIFSNSFVLEPGPKSWHRLGRAGGAGCRRKLISGLFIG